MGEFLAALDWPAASTWGVFACASGAVALILAGKHVVRTWHQWRLDRRLARDPHILREELNEYLFRIDDDLPPLDPARLLGSSLFVGALTAIPAWLAERHLQHWWEYGHWMVLAAGLLVGTWRWFNDPPEPRGDGTRQSLLGAFLGERDAVLGLGSAIAVIVLIMVAIFALF